MKVEIQLQIGNAATVLEDGTPDHLVVVSTLKAAVADIEQWGPSFYEKADWPGHGEGRVRDENGNTVLVWRIVHDDE